MGMGYSKGNVAENKAHKIIISVEADSDRYKWCAQCRQYRKVPKEWHSDVARYDGVSAECKPCNNRNRIIRRQKRRIEAYV